MTSDFQVGAQVMVDFDGSLTQGEALWRSDEIEDLWGEIIEWTSQQYYAVPHIVLSTARAWNCAYENAALLTGGRFRTTGFAVTRSVCSGWS